MREKSSWSIRRERQREVVLLVAVAVGTVVVSAVWWRIRNNRKAKALDATAFVPKIESTRSKLVSPPTWRSFELAAHRIRTASSRSSMTNGDQLLLYGLYKHIVNGDAPDTLSSSSSWNIVADQAKHRAWMQMRGMPALTAIEHYTSAVYHFVSAPEDTDDTAGSDGTDDGTHGMFGPSAVSRPVEASEDHDDDDEMYDAQDTSDEQKLLLQAASRNNVTMLQNLLSNINVTPSATDAINVNYADVSGQSALHLAADSGATDCVAALLQAGANVNAVDTDGISVLQAAVIAGHVATVRHLLEHGADPQLSDADGDTPASCAQDDGDEAMIQLFEEYNKMGDRTAS
jgi:acyl-CoA-binding protein